MNGMLDHGTIHEPQSWNLESIEQRDAAEHKGDNLKITSRYKKFHREFNIIVCHATIHESSNLLIELSPVTCGL